MEHLPTENVVHWEQNFIVMQKSRNCTFAEIYVLRHIGQ